MRRKSPTHFCRGAGQKVRVAQSELLFLNQVGNVFMANGAQEHGTVAAKNITYIEHDLALTFPTRLQLQLHNTFSREINFACASFSHGKNASITIAQVIPQRIIFAARLQLQLHEMVFLCELFT